MEFGLGANIWVMGFETSRTFQSSEKKKFRKLERDTRLSIQFQNVLGINKTGYPIFIAKPPTKANITAYGPS
jgi:hypothetical protein